MKKISKKYIKKIYKKLIKIEKLLRKYTQPVPH